MKNENSIGNPSWYLVYTNPKQEDRAASNLRLGNIETLLPRFREARCNQFTGQVIHSLKPLFSRYIFARFDLEKESHKVRYTRGVYKLISFGDSPVVVDEEIIEMIKSRLSKDGLAQIGEALQPGDPVIVKAGPLMNLVGVFERKMNDCERVSILIDAVSYQARVIFDITQINKFSQVSCGA